jgi:hypothetical protein
MADRTRLYVIGDKKTGIVIVLMDPLHAITVSTREIRRYARANKKTFDAALGELAEVIQKFITRADFYKVPADRPVVHKAFGAVIERGATITDAEFCFIADVDANKAKSLRRGFVPIESAIRIVADQAGKKGAKPLAVPLKGPGE